MQSVSRLIRTFAPEHYNLSLSLHRQDRRFNGTVTISGAVVESDTIRLHQKDLIVQSATVDGKEASFTLSEDEVVISHPDIAAGKHIIVIEFSGAINDEMHGLYPCYFEHDGEKKELLATQFESHHAREVFPCIDEPEAKATFDVTLTTEQNLTVLGNMPVKSQRVEKGALVTAFETTPRMSTYLVAWVVGELHKKTAKTSGGVEVNVWATPAQPPESLDFALDIATRTIEFFDEYFGVPYPLPKADHVALPDFSSGAMENWGLITYREVALLAHPKTSALSNRQQVALVIAHELSHQWFGNLVTMKWWNDLWLNESFANLMEYVAIDALQPDWNIWLDYASHEILQALGRDSLDGVQAIQTDVSHPDEISTLFDPSIVYAKGGRLLRMLKTYIGDEAFQAGLREYFSTFTYTNTEANDLWRCFSNASKQDITTLMNTWIGQPGYPLISVSESNGRLTLSQQRFFVGEHAPSSALWPVPLASTSPALPTLLDQQTLALSSTTQRPIILNHDSVSHFITRYDTSLQEEIVHSLETLSDIDRLSLLNEHLLLAQGEVISSDQLIPLLNRYEHEDTEAVWGIMAVTINQLKKFVETDEDAEQALKEMVGRLARVQYERLGWNPASNEPERDTKLRSTIISLMLYSDDKRAIKTAADLFLHTSIDSLDPELRTSILANAVRHTVTDTVIDDLLKLHQETTSSELQEDIAAALTATKDSKVIGRLLGLLTDKSVVRHQDFSHWFVWLLRNRYGRELTWSWIRDHWIWVQKTFGGDKSYDIFPRYIASSLVNAQQLSEYEAFFEPYKNDVALRRNIEVGITELRSRVALLERDGGAVRQTLLDL
jgi:aminopeptidase N